MNNSFGISHSSIELILKTIKSFNDIERVIIFGSRAMGTQKKGSDIDLAIYGNSIKSDTPLTLSAKLNEDIPTPYFIDVVAPDIIDNQKLLQHIERSGKVFLSEVNFKTNEANQVLET